MIKYVHTHLMDILPVWIFNAMFIYHQITPVSSFYYPSVEKNLTISLLNRYQYYGIFGRPVSSPSEIMMVHYGLQLIQILDLDESQQILRTNCWSMYKWQDRLLEWNPDHHAGITEIRVFPDQIWTPDIKLYNFADVRLQEARPARVVVSYSGETLWVPGAIYKSTCAVEITYFPFDTQICMLEFGSWTYDITQMNIHWWNESRPFLDYSDYLPSPEWRTDGEKAKHLHPDKTFQIRSVKKIRPRAHINGRGETVVKNYPVLRYLIRMRRNPNFYVSILIIPCVLLSSLTMVVFWLPPESPAKMMLGMNIFVAFFVLLLLLTDSTPSAVKKFPLIGAFFCLNMVMITLSTFLATIVINIYFRGDSTGPLPKLVRRIMIEGLGRLLRIRQKIPLQEETKYCNRIVTRDKRGRIKSYKVRIPDLKTNKFITASYQTMKLELKYCNKAYPESENGNYFENNVIWKHSTNPRSNYQKIPITNPIADTDNSPLLSSVSYPTTLEKNVHEIKGCIRQFVARQKENQRKNFVSMEWRTLALVLDRLFFIFYVSSIMIAVIACIPHSTEPEIPSQYRD